MDFAGTTTRRPFVPLLLLLAGLLLATTLPAGPETPDPAPEDSVNVDAPDTAETIANLPERYQRWLADVDLLISDAERDAFLGLAQDYQRDHFIRRFWKLRDPFPRTGANELRDAWEARIEAARNKLSDLDGMAARMMLYLGVPSSRMRLQCSQVMESIDVWVYEDGADRIAGYFTLIFVGHEKSPSYRLWEPSEGLRRLAHPGRGAGVGSSRRSSGGGFGSSDRELARLILQECIRGDDILAALAQALPVSELEERLGPARPNDEWVQAFQARSTDVDTAVEPLTAELALSFPGRNQSRTVVQGLVAVGRDGAVPTEGDRFYNFVLDGEVLRQNSLFDTFRYRFDFPVDGAPETLPVVVQRYLRPGEYRLIVKVEDLGSGRVFRTERDVQVPVFDPTVHLPAPPAVATTTPPSAETATTPPPPVFETRLIEANATISTGDHSIKILALPSLLSVGNLRVTVRTRGEGIARVAFELDGVEKLRKTRPPFSVELDLGKQPRLHRLRALALDADGKQLAVDEVVVNGGPHRFAVRLLSPQPGKHYTESVRAHVEVEVPESERLERVELFLNETRVATLFQPPFEQPIFLDGSPELAYVRVLATLKSGVTDEHVVFINAPDFIDDYRVNFVELYTTVIDRQGDFVEDLELAEVVVKEEGVVQGIRRFEKVRDLPINAGLVIDTSTSMLRVLRTVKTAAHRFLETVLTERDRAAIITFSDAPTLQVRFTSDPEILAGGLAGLAAEGETALFDSIIYALHYFSGVRGKRAIVVLTDGEDSTSEYSFNDALEFARQTGVSIYIIGLGLPTDPHSRSLMRRLADETGGEIYFIDRVGHLEKVYEQIQLELRSQYLIAYQSSHLGGGEDFREVEIKVDRKGLKAKTIRGYYP